MKLDKQMIEGIKEKITNIKNKISSNEKEKVPKKYYVLLVLMLALGGVTLTNNIKSYNISGKEEYKEYQLQEEQVNSNEVEVVHYQIAESSISTDASNYMEEQVVETISDNKQNNDTPKTNYIMPIDGEIIKEYATEKLVYSETLGMWKTHPGIDIKAKFGTSVKAASSGKVLFVGHESFYGNTVKIINDNDYIFVYCNLDDKIDLKEGDIVNKGDKIGTVGVSADGELADDAHLHFEIIKDDIQVNPLDLIN